MRVTPHGAFGFVRDDPASGLCSKGSYPCIHQGVDLAASAQGDYVYAPEPLRVWLAANRNDLRPFSRYGPAWVWAEGLDSGLWHLFAHLQVGSIRTAGDTTWESPDVDDYTESNYLVLGERYDLPEGMILGRTDPGKRHLHWETRLGVRGGTDAATRIGRKWQYAVTKAIKRDPMQWLRTGKPGTGLPGQVTTQPADDDGSELLLLAAAFLLLDD